MRVRHSVTLFIRCMIWLNNALLAIKGKSMSSVTLGFLSRPQMTDDEFLKAVPKAELHVHLEGTMSRELIERLAVKYQIKLPDNLFGERGNIAWEDFLSFLKAYDNASSVVCCAEALEEVAYDYLRRVAQEGGVYAELTVSPQHMARYGVSYQDAIVAVTRAIDRAKQDFDVDARMLVVLVRHQGIESPMWAKDHPDAIAAAEKLVDTVVENLPKTPYVVGIGLAGAEAEFPARLFANAFRKAGAAGLKLTAHAGEHTSPNEVLDAIKLLGVQRIGHGIHAAFSEEALQEVIEKRVHLEVCPNSNHELETHKTYPPGHDEHPHPLVQLHRQEGVRWSVNTDDPPFFMTKDGRIVSLHTEYEYAFKHLQLTRSQLLAVTRCAVEDSFAPDALKQQLLAKLEAFAQRHKLEFEKEPGLVLGIAR